MPTSAGTTCSSRWSCPLRRRWIALVAVLLLAAAGATVPGRVPVADAYWEILLGLHLVRPATYVGPHIWAVAFSPDGRRLAVGSMHQDVLLFDVQTGGALPSPAREPEWVMEVLWSPSGQWFASTSFSGRVTIRDAAGAVVHQSQSTDVAYTVAFHPVLPLAAWGSYDGGVRLVDLRTGAVERTIAAQRDGVLYTAFTPDGAGLVATGEDGVIRLFDLESGALTEELVGHTAGVTAVSFGPDHTLLSGGDDATVRLWNLGTGAQTRIERPHAGWVNFSTFLPGSSTFVTVGTDDDVFVWDGSAGSGSGEDGSLPPRRLRGHTDWLMCARPSADGALLATAGKDGTVRIWDTATWEVQRVIDVWAGVDPGGLRWPAL